MNNTVTISLAEYENLRKKNEDLREELEKAKEGIYTPWYKKLFKK